MAQFRFPDQWCCVDRHWQSATGGLHGLPVAHVTATLLQDSPLLDIIILIAIPCPCYSLTLATAPHEHLQLGCLSTWRSHSPTARRCIHQVDCTLVQWRVEGLTTDGSIVQQPGGRQTWRPGRPGRSCARWRLWRTTSWPSAVRTASTCHVPREGSGLKIDNPRTQALGLKPFLKESSTVI